MYYLQGSKHLLKQCFNNSSHNNTNLLIKNYINKNYISSSFINNNSSGLQYSTSNNNNSFDLSFLTSSLPKSNTSKSNGTQQQQNQNQQQQQHKGKVMIISGSTGVGKSALALKIAKSIGGEIVCADSVQVYKHLNIGSNKGRIDEVPHHLFDILEPNEDFNVKQYYDLATNAINDILSRGKVPIVVGGCGFYIDSLINGVQDYPIQIEDERKVIEMIEERLRAENNWYRVATILKDIDPESATRINRNDYKRLAKSFYVYSQTGLKFSDFIKKENETKENYDFRSFYITARRDALIHILNHRCELMIQNGLIKEVVDVLLSGLSPHAQVSRSIGYKQCINILLTPIENEVGLLDTINFLMEFQSVTRSYSRRQAIWFKKSPITRWLALNPLTENFQKYIPSPKSMAVDPFAMDHVQQLQKPTLDSIIEQFHMSKEEFDAVRDESLEYELKTRTKKQENLCREIAHEFQLFTSETSIRPLTKLINSGRSYLFKQRPELFTTNLNPHIAQKEQLKNQKLLQQQLVSDHQNDFYPQQ